MQDDRVRVDERALGEGGDDRGHRGGVTLHDDEDRRLGGLHGLEHHVARHHGTARRAVDDDEDRGFAIEGVVEGDATADELGELVVDAAVERDAAVGDVQDAVDERILRVGELGAAGDVGDLLFETRDGGHGRDLGVFDGDFGGGEAGLHFEFSAGAILIGRCDGGLGGGEGGF